MKLGADPKKVAILAGLVAVAGVALYVNVFAGDEPASPRPVAAPVAAVVTRPQAAGAAPHAETPARKTAGKTGVSEFRPRQGSATPEDKPDPAAVDPALHLDLLAKLQQVAPVAAGRNLFQYGAAPPPPPVPMPINVPKIPVNVTPVAPPGPGGPPPPPPPPPPPTFKYYGFKTARASGVKQAFLLDGEEIIIVGENEVVSKRYRVVRIAPASITVEDLQGKGQQTVAIEGQPAA